MRADEASIERPCCNRSLDSTRHDDRRAGRALEQIARDRSDEHCAQRTIAARAEHEQSERARLLGEHRDGLSLDNDRLDGDTGCQRRDGVEKAGSVLVFEVFDKCAVAGDGEHRMGRGWAVED